MSFFCHLLVDRLARAFVDRRRRGEVRRDAYLDSTWESVDQGVVESESMILTTRAWVELACLRALTCRPPLSTGLPHPFPTQTY